MSANAPAGRALLLGVLVAAALLAGARAGSINVTYEGADYELYTIVEATSSSMNDTFSGTFWWGNATAAEVACGLAGSSLVGQFDPPATFVYSANNTHFNGYLRSVMSFTCVDIWDTSDRPYTFALSTVLSPPPSPSPDASPEASPSASPEASPSASPEASPSASPEASPSASPEALPSASPEASPSASPEASPSPSPEASPSPSPVPLDCSLAFFSPPILSSRTAGQICAASKAVRQGKESKLVTNVTLSLLDANSQPAAINITDIVINKLTAGWQCGCRPRKRDNCKCLPNAWLLGGGNFSVFPQWRRNTVAGKVVDTTLQVSFTATAGDGGTCTGTAVICSAWGLRRNQAPPACTPFNSTGVTRPALTCI